MKKDNRWVYETVSDKALNVTSSTGSSSDKTYAKYTGYSRYGASMDNMSINVGQTSPTSSTYKVEGIAKRPLLCTKFKMTFRTLTDDYETYSPNSSDSPLVLTFQDGETERIVIPNMLYQGPDEGFEDKSWSTKYCDIVCPSDYTEIYSEYYFQIFIKVKDGCPAITGITVPKINSYDQVPAANCVSYVS